MQRGMKAAGRGIALLAAVAAPVEIALNRVVWVSIQSE